MLLARKVMTESVHVMLIGEGAEAFAREHDIAFEADEYFYTDYRWRQLQKARSRDSARYAAATPDTWLSTVGAVALDANGDLAAATSTGGTLGKLEGRVGDSPLIGPGTWADDDIAISFTGTGEHIIRSGGAISIAHKVAAGMTVERAIDEVLAEIARLGGDAGVIVVTRDGKIAMDYNSDGMKRASVDSSSQVFATTFD